ncbi:MAG: Mrp/NBP35 family ATP-binding protein [Pseudomonadota bacterium]
MSEIETLFRRGLTRLFESGEIKADYSGAVRAFSLQDGRMSCVLDLSADQAAHAKSEEVIIQALGKTLPGVSQVSIVMTAERKETPPPSLKVGRHPDPSAGRAPVPGVDRIIAIGSGKGGVGKSTVTSNLAVALSAKGLRVGLLDADIYGPSQPRMMGVSDRPSTPDGKKIIPLTAHGVTMMSLGLMVAEAEAVVWRGPMLMGALQQMLMQVQWGALDVLLVDLPPGTGDVQLTLAQKTIVDGAIVVSTPQDVALLDARKALNMFEKTKVPVMGLIENMSSYICPSCGAEAHIFGHGGVRDEAERLGLPYLGALPLDISVRLAGDGGRPAALSDGPIKDAFASLAEGVLDAIKASRTERLQ